MPTWKQKPSAWSERQWRDDAARCRRASENRLLAYALYDRQRKVQRSKVASAAPRPCAARVRGYYDVLYRESLWESLFGLSSWEPSPVDPTASKGHPPIDKTKKRFSRQRRRSSRGASKLRRRRFLRARRRRRRQFIQTAASYSSSALAIPCLVSCSSAPSCVRGHDLEVTPPTCPQRPVTVSESKGVLSRPLWQL